MGPDKYVNIRNVSYRLSSRMRRLFSSYQSQIVLSIGDTWRLPSLLLTEKLFPNILKITSGDYDNSYVFSLSDALGFEVGANGWFYVGEGIGYVHFLRQNEIFVL